MLIRFLCRLRWFLSFSVPSVYWLPVGSWRSLFWILLFAPLGLRLTYFVSTSLCLLLALLFTSTFCVACPFSVVVFFPRRLPSGLVSYPLSCACVLQFSFSILVRYISIFVCLCSDLIACFCSCGLRCCSFLF